MDMIWVNGKKKGIPGKSKIYLLRYGGRNELGLVPDSEKTEITQGRGLCWVIVGNKTGNMEPDHE